MIKAVSNFLNGRIGSHSLKNEYREIWFRFWLSVLLVLSVLGLFALIQITSWIVEWITYKIG